MSDLVDYYQLLGVPMTADIATIKHAYRTQIARHHPDRMGESADEAASLLNAAYTTLKDPAARKAYDLRLIEQRQRLWLTNKKHQFTAAATTFVKQHSKDLGDKFGGALGEHLSQKAGQMAGHTIQRAAISVKRLWQKFGQHPSIKKASDDLPVCRISLMAAYHGGQVRVTMADRSWLAHLPKGMSEGAVIWVTDGADRIAVRIMIESPDAIVRGKDVYYTAKIHALDAAIGAQIELPSPLSLTLSVPGAASYPNSVRLSGRGIPAVDGAGDLVVVFEIDG